MGHIHLGVLPKTKRWREVVDLLTNGAGDADVIAASAQAAEKDLLSAGSDPVFVEAVRLLAMLPVAARSSDFAQALRDLDLPVRAEPDLFALLGAVGHRMDEVARSHSGRNDFSELARRALLSSLMTHIGDQVPKLLSATPADVRVAARAFSHSKQFSVLARGFFTRLLGETLRYWLDRELANHVGRGARYSAASERSDFDLAIMQYCMEATLIVKEFARGWYGKTLYRDGAISTDTAAAFGAVSFRKICEELRLKRDQDA